MQSTYGNVSGMMFDSVETRMNKPSDVMNTICTTTVTVISSVRCGFLIYPRMRARRQMLRKIAYDICLADIYGEKDRPKCVENASFPGPVACIHDDDFGIFIYRCGINNTARALYNSDMVAFTDVSMLIIIINKMYLCKCINSDALDMVIKSMKLN